MVLEVTRMYILRSQVGAIGYFVYSTSQICLVVINHELEQTKRQHLRNNMLQFLSSKPPDFQNQSERSECVPHVYIYDCVGLLNLCV